MSVFSAWDYLIFFAYLGLSVAVGLYAGRGQSSLKDYFLAGGSVNRFIVAMTVLAALFSGISYLAAPSQTYKSGFAFALIMFSFFLATPFVNIWLMPFFYKARYFTAYHWLEDRFSPSVRLLASGLFILRVTLWLAAAIFAPALALKQVTGLPLSFTILCTGLVTTLYTTHGGMKAVIWTDVMQLMVLLGGQVLIVGIAAARIPGGLGEVWSSNLEAGRFDISLSLDPREKFSLFGVLIGGAILNLVQMATDQVSVQRYLTAGSLREARRSLWIKLWFTVPVLVLFYGTGMVLWTFYGGQDLLGEGKISKMDALLPYFVVNELPAGMAGLLIAAIFAASMSTTSAGLNSLTTATLCDFYQRLSKGGNDESRQLRLAKYLTVFYGILVTVFAFAIAKMRANLVESVNSIIGLVGGPLLGVFLLGMFVRRANARGTLIGCLGGFVTALLVFLAQNSLHDPSFAWFRSAVAQAGLWLHAAWLSGAVEELGKVSFLWLTAIGMLVTMVLGRLTSGRSAPPSDLRQ